eukprot:TRINITY_DN943_c0_g1_i2.p5 TRINITY_DN943_c0_g1~~TRINITY_DN943_c0_g1_i2.p5  ORF type:complete len:57 (-),score=8.25 TRINITY_DN943_c0_g1_i2:546-716(-)
MSSDTGSSDYSLDSLSADEEDIITRVRAKSSSSGKGLLHHLQRRRIKRKKPDVDPF